jgi:phosphoserine aminotransferase
MQQRGYNFGAGPAMLPEEILKEAQLALWNWHQTGMSILEIGHRTELFMDLMAETESLCRQILNIPEHYAVLFIGGSARAQFGNIPLNILQKDERAGYISTGMWSDMSYQEAKRLCPNEVYELATGASSKFVKAPIIQQQIEAKTKYLYFTSNETIVGFRFMPDATYPDIPWVSDMTSSLFSEPLEIEKYGLIFAGAQKNIANAGLVVAIVRRDWLQRTPHMNLPSMQDYRTYDKYQSLYATPPTFNCYLMNLMMKWIIKQGGVGALYQTNLKKAQLLYDFLDESKVFNTFVKPPHRSIMNVSFTSGLAEKDLQLVHHAEQHGLLALKGHRSFGGLRASIYNAMPIEGVHQLIKCLSDFS